MAWDGTGYDSMGYLEGYAPRERERERDREKVSYGGES